jgi:hypothetical protein
VPEQVAVPDVLLEPVQGDVRHVRTGGHFMNLRFGRKIRGQFFALDFWSKFHPKLYRHF